MHTVMVLGGGLALLAAMIVIGRALGAKASSVALAFVPLWFIVAAANMWIGVTSAGYSVAEEFPIFIGIFALPAVIAMIIWWKNTRR